MLKTLESYMEIDQNRLYKIDTKPMNKLEEVHHRNTLLLGDDIIVKILDLRKSVEEYHKSTDVIDKKRTNWKDIL